MRVGEHDAAKRLTSSAIALPLAIMAAGLLVMLVAGIAAARSSPSWFDPDDPCGLPNTCDTSASRAIVGSLWFAVAAGGVLVLTGVVLTWRRLDRGPSVAPAFRVALTRAAITGFASWLTFAVLGPLLLMSTLLAWHALVAAACGVWLLHGWISVWVDREVHPASSDPRRAGAVGLLAGLIGLSVVAVATASSPGASLENLPLVAAAAGVGVVVTCAIGLGVRRHA